MEISVDNSAVKTAQELGLLESEYYTICEMLGRAPNFTEMAIFSVMWSEHCSYKNSIKWLKTLPREGAHLLAEAGEENAGLVDIGDGLACAFKIESHNHPSALEPYQGAATGVGGIHRDIFTMGARPIAALNSLRFGSFDDKRTKHLLKGVVAGIGDYGNCFGVPTVGGEIYFDECYHTNPLVNAMSVGIVEAGKTLSATSYGPGNPVFIVGSATGKDGIQGASFASKEITDDSVNDLPAVQVGDPFQEKLLLEASLELAQTDAVVGMQDMGAAGITCSTSEMSAKEGFGMDIHLNKVPMRQDDMKPFEILLSESQERMLVVVKKGKEAVVQNIFDKWDLNCTQIGTVTEGGILRYYMHGEKVAEIDADLLVLGGQAPVYDREIKEPEYFKAIQAFNADSVSQPADLRTVAKRLIGSPNIASKRWVFEQYDSMVGLANTSVNQPSDAAIIRFAGSKKKIAVTVDCNSRYVWADPYNGAMIAVAEAARNISCSGGKPLAITNCLNFGNPYKPEVYWQFSQAIKGMGEACRKFETPVTGGNVSFYNQSTDGGAVYPTPTIGMIGMIDAGAHAMTLNFKTADDLIYLVGTESDEISSSEYVRLIHGLKECPCPEFDLNKEFELQLIIRQLIADKLIASAHDLSEGGLFCALLESGMPDALGFNIQLKKHSLRLDGQLFGEAQSRVLVSVEPEHKTAFENRISESGVEFSQIGAVQQENLHVNGENWGSISEWTALHQNAISKGMA